MSRGTECCRKTFLFLAELVASLGSVAYCFYLIGLLAYVKDDGNYCVFVFIFFASVKTGSGIEVLLGSVTIMAMCTFTLLTRQAYYHLSADVFIGPQWVIISLEGSIVFFVCSFLAHKECRLQKILQHKEVLTRGLLDFVDIFNMVELLSLNKYVGIGLYVAEGSSLEMAIQAFCTMSILIMACAYFMQEDYFIVEETVHVIYIYSLIFQNIPFLVIRIIVWSKYNVFSLSFMVKNVLAIVMCCAKLLSDDELKVNRAVQCNYNNGYDNDNDNGDGDGNGNNNTIN